MCTREGTAFELRWVDDHISQDAPEVSSIMARKKPPGLVKRAGVWHVDKHIDGQRVCQSTGTDRPDETERFLARLTEESRQAWV